MRYCLRSLLQAASIAVVGASGRPGSLEALRAKLAEPMLAFVRTLGFTVKDDPEDPGQLCTTLLLH
jgi:hypothetical protein